MRVLVLAPLLASCAVVSIHSEGGSPRLSVWPLGVRVERGNAGAVSVSATAVGLSSGCGTASAGIAHIDCDVIDTDRCGVALVHAPADHSLIERLAAANRAECPIPKVKP